MKRWEENLWLLTVDEYTHLPDGTELTCIDGEVAVKGRDDIDLDTRFGYIAYGIVDPFSHPLRDQLLFFRLAT